jgi:hypothetical protein
VRNEAGKNLTPSYLEDAFRQAGLALLVVILGGATSPGEGEGPFQVGPLDLFYGWE